MKNLLLPLWAHSPIWMRRLLIWFATPHFIAGLAVMCFDGNGNILMLKHAFHPEHPWGLPTGWLKRHESPVQAAERELTEETKLKPKNMHLYHVQARGPWIEMFYICEVDMADVRLQHDEVTEFQWLSLQRALALDPPPGQRLGLERLHNEICAHHIDA